MMCQLKSAPRASSNPSALHHPRGLTAAERKSRLPGTEMKWVSYGPNAWLVQFAERPGQKAFDRGRAIALHLERDPPPGLIEFVPAFTTVLLEFEPGACGDKERRALSLRFRKAAGARLPTAPLKEVPVKYDGPDLDRVVAQSGLTAEQVCARHAAPIYKVYALGFSPGFPYLGDLDPRLHIPRLATPRLRVPAGSVAIGGEHTGIYPIESPGGWNLIGSTPVKLFDLAACTANGGDRNAFYLRPWDRVKFIPVELP